MHEINIDKIMIKIIIPMFWENKAYLSFCKGCIRKPRLEHCQFMKRSSRSKVFKKTKEDSVSLITIH